VTGARDLEGVHGAINALGLESASPVGQEDAKGLTGLGEASASQRRHNVIISLRRMSSQKFQTNKRLGAAT